MMPNHCSKGNSSVSVTPLKKAREMVQRKTVMVAEDCQVNFLIVQIRKCEVYLVEGDSRERLSRVRQKVSGNFSVTQ
jgi:hypothetical protein